MVKCILSFVILVLSIPCYAEWYISKDDGNTVSISNDVIERGNNIRFTYESYTKYISELYSVEVDMIRKQIVLTKDYKFISYYSRDEVIKGRPLEVNVNKVEDRLEVDVNNEGQKIHFTKVVGNANVITPQAAMELFIKNTREFQSGFIGELVFNDNFTKISIISQKYEIYTKESNEYSTLIKKYFNLVSNQTKYLIRIRIDDIRADMIQSYDKNLKLIKEIKVYDVGEIVERKPASDIIVKRYLDKNDKPRNDGLLEKIVSLKKQLTHNNVCDEDFLYKYYFSRKIVNKKLINNLYDDKFKERLGANYIVLWDKDIDNDGLKEIFAVETSKDDIRYIKKGILINEKGKILLSLDIDFGIVIDGKNVLNFQSCGIRKGDLKAIRIGYDYYFDGDMVSHNQSLFKYGGIIGVIAFQLIDQDNNQIVSYNGNKTCGYYYDRIVFRHFPGEDLVGRLDSSRLEGSNRFYINLVSKYKHKKNDGITFVPIRYSEELGEIANQLEDCKNAFEVELRQFGD